MQRKPGFPVANCSIKLPDSMPVVEGMLEEEEPIQRRQQLINFGHSEWGFNNWSWTVTKQELDFVELTNGKYTAGVASFVSVIVKTLDIQRENIGYATSIAPNKGAAIHRARKCAVTNALRETLLSFGGSVATNLMEVLESHKSNDVVNPPPPRDPEPLQENNQNLNNKLSEPKNIKQNIKKDMNIQAPVSSAVPVPVPVPVVPGVKNIVNPPVAKAHPMPANLPPANRGPPANAPRPPVPPPTVRPNSNEVKFEDLSEDARAERKRRQRLAQEEFRLKYLLKNNSERDLDKESDNSLDVLMLAIPTQDIEIESTGDTGGKRKSPVLDGSAKRRSTVNRLDIYKA
ncbi:unnamed protein product, partial [Brenthis ino]